MKIKPYHAVLISPRPAKDTPQPPLALGCLKAFADSRFSHKKNPPRITILEAWAGETPKRICAMILNKKPDLAGFSCYCWNIEKIAKVCAILKKRSPGIKILLGGPEVLTIPEKVLGRIPADFAACGEGEETFAQLLEEMIPGGKLRRVRGLVFRDGNRIVSNPPRPPIKNLGGIPSPFLSGAIKAEKGADFPIEISRGCPFACKYCTWNVSKIRYFPAERILKELKLLFRQSPEMALQLVTTDFFLNKGLAGKILKSLRGMSAEKGFKWLTATWSYMGHWKDIPAGINTDNFFLLCGIQSVNARPLRMARRFFDRKKIEGMIKKLKSSSPRTRLQLEFILGMPGDTLEGFRRTLDWALSMKHDSILIQPLSLFPESAFRMESQKLGLSFEKSPPYLIRSLPGFPEKDIKKAKFLSYAAAVLRSDPGIRSRLEGLGDTSSGRFPYLRAYEEVIRTLEKTGFSLKRKYEQSRADRLLAYDDWPSPFSRGGGSGFRNPPERADRTKNALMLDPREKRAFFQLGAREREKILDIVKSLTGQKHKKQISNRVTLVSLRTHRTRRQVPLAAGCLKSYADRTIGPAPEITILEEWSGSKTQVILKKIMKDSPCIVGFSCYVWNVEKVCELCRKITSLREKTVLVLGGPEASAKPKEILRASGADFVVTGEGEVTFSELVRRTLNGEDLSGVRGTVHRLKDRILVNPPRPPIQNLDAVASPWLSKTLKAGPGSEVVLEMSRGCPHKCRFCTNGPQRVRRFSRDRILSELKALSESKSSFYIQLACADFFDRPAEAARMISEFDKIARAGGSKWIMAMETHTENLGKIVPRALNSGRFHLFAGIQTVNGAPGRIAGRLTDMKKHGQAIARLRRLAPLAPLNTEIILGLPGDTLEGFTKTLDWTLSVTPNHVLVYRLLLLPGSDFSERAGELGIEHSKKPPYAVISLPGFGDKDLGKAHYLAFAVSLLRCDRLIRQGMDRVAQTMAGRELMPHVCAYKKLLARLEENGDFNLREHYHRTGADGLFSFDGVLWTGGDISAPGDGVPPWLKISPDNRRAILKALMEVLRYENIPA